MRDCHNSRVKDAFGPFYNNEAVRRKTKDCVGGVVLCNSDLAEIKQK